MWVGNCIVQTLQILEWNPTRTPSWHNSLCACNETSFPPPMSDLLLTTLIHLLGVCFLVGILFMALVGVEMAWEKAMDKYNSYRGKNNAPETHPASLVGTFSRYKWNFSCKTSDLIDENKYNELYEQYWCLEMVKLIQHSAMWNAKHVVSLSEILQAS